jgi:soluble lytic murein transglycosylase-like protein
MTIRARLLALLLFAAILACTPAHACWEAAARRYGVDVRLLYAIAKTESSINPRAINRNRNGSYDVGLMQINSSWFQLLKRHGIEEKHLYDPCVSLQVGSWILAQNLQRLRDPWLAVGAYNSPTPAKARAYALKVYRNLPPAPD